jgi:uncharacterized protein GlcG (DUF336 family)
VNGLVKKALGALAIKEGIERIQDMRRPKPSLLSRLLKPLLLVSVAGGIVYLQKTGKLGPLVQQAKGLAGAPGNSYTGDPASNGSTSFASTTAGSV